MFEHIISLGWFCGTAASLSKNGFREASGPFDWMYSDLPAVLHFLETSFEGYLDKNYLEVIDEKNFKDYRGLYYKHDTKCGLEKEYDDIYEKYQRRIYKMTQYKNICFIRAVRSQEEIEYIKNNREYINKVIADNEVIFLIPQYMHYDKFPFKYFKLNIYGYQGDFRSAMRNLFDKAEGLIGYLKENYSEEKRNLNLYFDHTAEYKRLRKGVDAVSIEKTAICTIDKALRQIYINEERCQNLARMIKTDFSKVKLPQDVDIYGLGAVGESFYFLIKNICHVNCFIDKKGGNAEIPVIKFDEYNWTGNDIIVTPTFFIDEIIEALKTKGISESQIISLHSFIGKA